MLSDEMLEHAENEDFTSIKAVYQWASRVEKLEADLVNVLKIAIARGEGLGYEDDDWREWLKAL